MDGFAEDHPGSRVRLVAVGSQDDHQTQLATAFAAGRPPDLFLIKYRRFGGFAARGALEALGPLVERRGRLDVAGLFPQATDAFRFAGSFSAFRRMSPHLSSITTGRCSSALGCDRRERAGPGRTCSHGEDAHRRRCQGPRLRTSLDRFAPFIWQAGGEVVDSFEASGKVALLEAADREALQFLTDLQQQHEVVPTLAEQESEDPETRFANGRLGMLIESRRATTGLRAVDGLDWDVAPLPVHPRRREPAVMLHSDANCSPRIRATATATSPWSSSSTRSVSRAQRSSPARAVRSRHCDRWRTARPSSIRRARRARQRCSSIREIRRLRKSFGPITATHGALSARRGRPRTSSTADSRACARRDSNP